MPHFKEILFQSFLFFNFFSLIIILYANIKSEFEICQKMSESEKGRKKIFQFTNGAKFALHVDIKKKIILPVCL